MLFTQVNLYFIVTRFRYIFRKVRVDEGEAMRLYEALSSDKFGGIYKMSSFISVVYILYVFNRVIYMIILIIQEKF